MKHVGLSKLIMLSAAFALLGATTACTQQRGRPAAAVASGGPSFALSSGDPKVPYFNTVWIEPFAWRFDWGQIPAPATTADLRAAIGQLKSVYHVKRIVIAYSEYLGCFTFNPWQTYSWLTWWASPPVQVSSADPKQRCPIVSDASDPYATFVGTVLTEAAKPEIGIDVFVGLSRVDDDDILNDIENRYRNLNQFSWDTLNARLKSVLFYSRAMAKDLFDQFGKLPSFAGWYLPHETSCVDIGMNVYKELGKYLKSLDASKGVMISPFVFAADACFSSAGYEYLVRESKPYVDWYAYQDTVGAGGLFNPSTRILTLYYTDAARQQTIYEMNAKGRLAELQGIHARTGTRFLMNVEAWEMNGDCPTGKSGGNPDPNKKYGCNYPGPWKRVNSQLQAYQYATTDLMLNEALSQLEIGSPGTRRASDSQRKAAADFSAAYRAYLGSQ